MTFIVRRVMKAVRARLRPSGQRILRVVEFDPFEWLKREYRFQTLIDIGANNGDYGAFVSRHFQLRHAYFFEPQQAYQRDLGDIASRVPHGRVFPYALSDSEGEAEFVETNYGPSGSLLPPAPAALAEFPENAAKRRVKVPLRRLDDVLTEPLEEDVIIKIDVQGVEDRVIRGGRRVFGAARVVLVEMSFVPFYEGQPLFEEVHELLVGCGLRFAGIKNQIMMPETLRPGFAHCIYLRPATV
jgi:FkbM family methyltransferase